jgi:hypothetical protein
MLLRHVDHLGDADQAGRLPFLVRIEFGILPSGLGVRWVERGPWRGAASLELRGRWARFQRRQLRLALTGNR